MGRIEIHQKDANADELRKAAQQLGMSVEPMGRPVDYLVGYKGLTVAVEVKTEKGRLRTSQVQFLERFTGAARVWRNVNDVIATRAHLEAQAEMLRKDDAWEP